VNEHYPDRLDFNTIVGNTKDLKDTTGSPLIGPDVGQASEFPEYYMYEGSVTVPPCTPHVQYFVRSDPMLVNPERLDQIITTIARTVGQTDGNFRMTQPLGDRNVTRILAEDAAGLQTLEEVLAAHAVPTDAPVVPITDEHSNWDPSHEDAVAETEATKLDAHYSDPTEFTVEQQRERAADVPSVVAAFDHTKILDDPDGVAGSLTMVTKAQKDVDAAKQEVTQAELDEQKAARDVQLAQQARDFSEGYDNLTLAESQLLTAQDTQSAKAQVVAARKKKLETFTNAFDSASAEAKSIVWAAGKQVEILNNASANLGVADGGVVNLKFMLPTGSAADPFSRHNAETVSRITAATGRLPRHLGPGLGPNHPAVWGTVPVLPLGDDQGLAAKAAVGDDEASSDDGVVEQPQPVVETMTTSA